MKAKLKAAFLLLSFLLAVPAAHGRNLEVQRLLTRLNKPPLISIQSPDGDTIDCVEISRQPAFDHPLLKNHTIQMRPSYHPEGVQPFKSKVKRNNIVQLWQRNGRCPEGTIPVRRTKEEDILRAPSVKTYGKKSPKSLHTNASALPEADVVVNHNQHLHALAYVTGDKYYGTKASLSIWEPIIEQPDEFSLSQIWITAGSYEQYDLNTVEAGWHVFPSIYRGDDSPRLFIYWTRDAYYSSGCYNLICPGFVQTSNDVVIGGSIGPISEVGNSQHDVTILVWKDPKEGNWWLQWDNHEVGYWPGTLFTHLSDSGSVVEWGGEVLNMHPGGQPTGTEMGSGHFPDEGFGKVGYIKNIQVIDSSNNLQAPKGVGVVAQQPSCYNVMPGESADWGNYIFYGGPGRNPNCP